MVADARRQPDDARRLNAPPPDAVVGVDGCRSGWVAVWIAKTRQRGFCVVPSIADVVAFRPAMTLIDMPIGLPDSGARACDPAARAMLKPHSSRVFIDARRPLLALRNDYAAANRWAKSDGNGISKQLFHILPKIAEVDAVMTPARQATTRESHPELIFLRLNRGVPLPSKKTEAGHRQRRELIRDVGFADIGRWLTELRGTGAKPDDLLDACACASAALRVVRGTAQQVACGDARDAKGLRMEMWY